MELMMRQFNNTATGSHSGSIASNDDGHHSLGLDSLGIPIAPPQVSPSPVLSPPHLHQGPPPPMALSDASLIADCWPPRFNFAMPARSGSAIPTYIGLDFSPPKDSRHKHQALRDEELYVPGYYYQNTHPYLLQMNNVSWLAQLLNGPYAGKQDRINKLYFALSDNTLSGFMKFYTALCAGLNGCGFSPHLLPILPLKRPDTNVIDTPIIESLLIGMGTGQDPTNLRQPDCSTLAKRT
jgi:hypothetical protein